jgi:hypothetical protein
VCTRDGVYERWCVREMVCTRDGVYERWCVREVNVNLSEKCVGFDQNGPNGKTKKLAEKQYRREVEKQVSSRDKIH